VLDQAAEIRRGYQELTAARERDRELGRKATDLLALNQRIGAAERAVQAARSTLEAEEARLAAEAARLERLAASRAALESDLAAARNALGELDAEAARLAALQERLQAALGEAGGLEAENARLRQEMQDLRRKIDELAGAEARCPLCGTELGEDGQRHIMAAYEGEGKERAARFRENQARVRALQAEVERLRRETQQGQAALSRRRSEVDGRLAALEGELARAVQAETEAAPLRERLAQVRADLAAGAYAAAERAELARLQAERDALAYDEAEHRAVRERLAALERYDALHRRLGEAETLAAREEEALARAESNRAAWLERLREAEAEAARAREELERHPDVAAGLEAAARELATLRGREQALRQALGAVRQKLEDCRRLEEDRERRLAALRLAQEEKKIHEDLAVAFGKRGIQALIIDTALPEIEEEANRLLARMTNNRMSIAMSTQRETRRGTVQETLDIRIADELGTRDYEMFSGGEAFRINLALRIALSRLLARRAGAPLPTLIIDEGFGTQDAAARERLVEAITAIQDDFQCLLVITHIDELKDVFPTRLEVHKTPQGSVVQVT
ncbi:MAG TPA: SbcC/MukB-like Walker B domain-containing protein, partial [Dehalococcoidia bacterium]